MVTAGTSCLKMLGFPQCFESFNDWGGGRGCNKFSPVLGGDVTKVAPPGNLFDQPPDEMN